MLRAHPGTAAELRAWSREEDRWLRRAAILAQLRHGDLTDRDLLADVVEPNLTEPDFFVRDMLTWALTRLPAADTVVAGPKR